MFVANYFGAYKNVSFSRQLITTVQSSPLLTKTGFFFPTIFTQLFLARAKVTSSFLSRFVNIFSTFKQFQFCIQFNKRAVKRFIFRCELILYTLRPIYLRYCRRIEL